MLCFDTYFEFCIEYAKHLTDLPPLPHAKKCHGYMCDKRPKCHTDFKPNYTHNMTLTELVVGHTNWTYDAGIHV